MLGAGPAEVVRRVIDAKVRVAIEKVGKKPHGLLECQHNGAVYQSLPFVSCDPARRALEVALGKVAEHLLANGDGLQIRFVLGPTADGRADQVPEIMGGETRHHRIEVDNT